ncbi:hypothetical protein IIA94_02520 [Patescibacteria group bacterium]|nr:hypothetical protein [Patescibacteria group bacterium]
MHGKVFTKVESYWHGAVIFVLLCSLYLIPNLVYAIEYSSTNFILRDPVITIGGGRATSTSFELFSSVGQTTIGENTSLNFIHRAGFLYFPAPAADATPAPTLSPAGISTAGSGGGVLLPQINFSGQTTPGDTIVLLKDAQLAATTNASPSGTFFIRLAGLSTGTYIFSLYSESKTGRRSSLVIFSVEVFAKSLINITDIFFGPGIRRDITEEPCADPNEDGRVDLVDFSTLIFWFDKSNIPSRIDCNGDGKADLTDFSIMAFYWTG